MYFFHTYVSNRAFCDETYVCMRKSCISKLKERLIFVNDIIYLSVMYLMTLSVDEFII